MMSICCDKVTWLWIIICLTNRLLLPVLCGAIPRICSATEAVYLTPMKSPTLATSLNCDHLPTHFSLTITFKMGGHNNELDANDKSSGRRNNNKKRNRYISEEQCLIALVTHNVRDRGYNEYTDLSNSIRNKPPDKYTYKQYIPDGHIELGVCLYGDAVRVFHWDERQRVYHFPMQEIFDDDWHTLGVVITSNSVQVSADCGSVYTRNIQSDKASEMMLSLEGLLLHIGSIGKSHVFTGELKHVIYQAGDITLCTSHISNDPPVFTTMAASTLPQTVATAVAGSPYNEQCSWQNTGQTWFDVRDKTLKVCYSGIWQSILAPPSERNIQHLEYFVWQQDIITSAPTIDIEVFNIPDEGLFMATASFDSRNMKKTQSAIFKWDNGAFKLYQSLYTYGAQAFEHFQIDKQFFLAVANTGMDSTKPSFSIIYRWHRKRKRFRVHQELSTWTARDIEYFQIDNLHYLIVANHRIGENHKIDSVLYVRYPKEQFFEPYQNISTTGAYDWTHFSVDGYHFLVVANSFTGPPVRTTQVNSMVYFWRKGQFLLFQTLETYGATDFEFFRVNDDLYLAVANALEYGVDMPQSHTTTSVIYQLDHLDKRFKVYQNIITHSAVDWESFTIGDDTFLVVSNAQHNSSAPSESTVYRWQGVEKFVPVHHLETRPSADWETFTLRGSTYIVYANADANISQVFKAIVR